MTDPFASADAKRTRKPKPLFGLFRKTRPDQLTNPGDPLGSGASVPLSSVVTAPLCMDSHVSMAKSKPTLVMAPSKSSPLSRTRSRSEGREVPSREARPCTRSLTAREKTLNKLCERELTSSLSPAQPKSPKRHAPPPLPPMPIHNPIFSAQSVTPPGTPKIPRKPPSSSDLQKMRMYPPETNAYSDRDKTSAHKFDNARSRSLSAPKHFNQPAWQPANTVPPMPTTSRSAQHRSRGTDANISKPRRTHQASRDERDDEDDDIPLAAMLAHPQRQKSQASSLLDDDEEEDDQDLVPIAELPWAEDAGENKYQSAADKYKEKVKGRLLLDDDDDLPISRFVAGLKIQPCVEHDRSLAINAL